MAIEGNAFGSFRMSVRRVRRRFRATPHEIEALKRFAQLRGFASSGAMFDHYAPLLCADRVDDDFVADAERSVGVDISRADVA